MIGWPRISQQSGQPFCRIIAHPAKAVYRGSAVSHWPQNPLGQTGLKQQFEARAGIGERQQAVELIANPLVGHDAEPVGHGQNGGCQRWLRGQPELSQEPCRPQHAQGVVAERRLRVQRRAEKAVSQVGCPTEGIHQSAIGKLNGHGVDGEVAPGEIGLDGVGKNHIGLAGARLVPLGAVRGDLNPPVAPASADGAEALPLGPQSVGPALQDRFHRGRLGVGGEVQVEAGVQRQAQQGVAHHPAHQIYPVASRGEPLSQLSGFLSDRGQALQAHDNSAAAAAATSAPGPPPVSWSKKRSSVIHKTDTPPRYPRLRAA